MPTVVYGPVTNTGEVAVLDVELSRGPGGEAGHDVPRREPLRHSAAARWVWVAHTLPMVIVQNFITLTTFGDLSRGL